MAAFFQVFVVREYAVGAATVGISWSRYLVKFLDGFGITLPSELIAGPWDGGIINLPAVFIIVLMSLLLIKGTKESAFVNSIIVVVKIAVVLTFIILGWQYINNDNYDPYIPDNTGKFGDFGFSGIIRAAAIVFFAYIGFDAVSTAAQEAKNPKKDMPIGILGSLLICTVLYIFFAHVMTGVTSYTTFAGKDGIAPVAVAIDHMGAADAAGVIKPDYPWLNRAIVVAILFGYASVILVMLMGQSRVFFSMSKDGLIPKIFSAVNPKTQTPAKNNFLFMIFVSAFAAFVPARVVGEMTSIGTLFAFILVCVGVWVMRKKMPDLPRAFKTPMLCDISKVHTGYGFIPKVSHCTDDENWGKPGFSKMDTWIRLLVWMLIGLDIYLVYGAKNSHLGNGTSSRKGMKLARLTGIALAVLLAIVGFLHQNTVGFDADKTLLYISLAFAVVHAGLYASKLGRAEDKA